MRKLRVAEVQQPDHSSHTGKQQSQGPSIHALGYHDPCHQKLHGLVGETGAGAGESLKKDNARQGEGRMTEPI